MDEALAARVAALDEWAVETAMRLSAQEFVLEVLLANRFARRPAEDVAEFVEDIASPFRPAYSARGGLDAASLRAATERISLHVEALVRKAAARAENLRATAQSQGREFL